MKEEKAEVDEKVNIYSWFKGFTPLCSSHLSNAFFFFNPAFKVLQEVLNFYNTIDGNEMLRKLCWFDVHATEIEDKVLQTQRVGPPSPPTDETKNISVRKTNSNTIKIKIIAKHLLEMIKVSTCPLAAKGKMDRR